MEKLRLARFDGHHIDFEAMDAFIESFRMALDNYDNNPIDNYDLERILDYQENDGFFGLVNDRRGMDGDCRVDFIYIPTYLLSSLLMRYILEHPDVLKGERKEKVTKALEACTGRNFTGHGMDREEGLVNCLDILEKGHAEEFVTAYPELCPRFTTLWNFYVHGVEPKEYLY